MPIITITLYEGRTIDQKRQMSEEITEVVSRIARIKKAGVNILFNEIKKNNWSTGGILLSDIDE
jgi:4-oxalocrotonate tautomerase